MDCREIRELLSDYLDGRLGPGQVASFEQHLDGCRGCKQETEALRTTISLIGSLGEVETSPDFLNQVQKKIDAKGSSWGIWAWLFEPVRVKVPLELTALILVSIGALHLYYRSPELSREPGVLAPSEQFQVAREKANKELRAERGRQATKGGRATVKPEPPASMPKSSELPEEASQGQVADFSRRAGGPSSLEASKAAGDKVEEKALDMQGRMQEGDQIAKKGAVTERLAAARKSEMHEILADDVDFVEARIKALLEQFGGKLLTQESAPGSELLLTVELPRSRQTEFLAALKEMDREAKLPGSERGATSAIKNQLQQKRSQLTGDAAGIGTASGATASPRTDEPTVTLQLRILPKR